MDLELPLDATAAASLWTWAAVLVVALGLWGIKAAGAKSDASPATITTTTTTSPSPCELSATPTSTQPAPQATNSERIPAEETGTPRTRFTAYYCSRSLEARRHGDGDISDEDEEGAEENARGRATVTAPEPWSAGAWTVPKRQRDLGWYRYQDVAALNGSVVRLWDGGRGGRFASTATATRMDVRL